MPTSPGDHQTSRARSESLPSAAAVGLAEPSIRARFVSASLPSRWRASPRRRPWPGSSRARPMPHGRSRPTRSFVVEIQRPDRLIDRAGRPAVSRLPQAVAAVSKAAQGPEVRRAARGRQRDRRPARHHLGQGTARADRRGNHGGARGRRRARGRGFTCSSRPRTRSCSNGPTRFCSSWPARTPRTKGSPNRSRRRIIAGWSCHALGDDKGAAYGIVAGKLAISNSVKNLERLIDRMVAMPATKRRARGLRKGRLRVARRAGGVENTQREARCRLARLGLRRHGSIAAA